MTESEEREYPTGTNRVGMTEFLNELDMAVNWMLWVSPNIGEIELFVKGADDRVRVYHGPEPTDVGVEEYKAFLKTAEEMADKKDAEEGEKNGTAQRKGNSYQPPDSSAEEENNS